MHRVRRRPYVPCWPCPIVPWKRPGDSDERRRAGDPVGALKAFRSSSRTASKWRGSPRAPAPRACSGAPAGDAPLVARIRAAGAVVLGTTNLSEWANIRSPRSSGGRVGRRRPDRQPVGPRPQRRRFFVGVGGCPGRRPGTARRRYRDGRVDHLSRVAQWRGWDQTHRRARPPREWCPSATAKTSPGPMARHASDVAILLEVAGSVVGVAERVAQGVHGLRVGVARDWRTGHPATDALFEEIVEEIRGSGVEVTDVSPALPHDGVHADELTVLLCELKDGMDHYMRSRGPGGPRTWPK